MNLTPYAIRAPEVQWLEGAEAMRRLLKNNFHFRQRIFGPGGVPNCRLASTEEYIEDIEKHIQETKPSGSNTGFDLTVTHYIISISLYCNIIVHRISEQTLVQRASNMLQVHVMECLPILRHATFPTRISSAYS